MLSENICPFNTGSSDNKHEHHSPESKYSCKREWRIKFKYDIFKHTLRPRLSSLKEAFCFPSYSAARNFGDWTDSVKESFPLIAKIFFVKCNQISVFAPLNCLKSRTCEYIKYKSIFWLKL